MVEPTVLFGMMFGNEMFENHVGQLRLLSLTPAEFDPDEPPEVQKPKLEKIMKVCLVPFLNLCNHFSFFMDAYLRHFHLFTLRQCKRRGKRSS